MDLNSGNGPKTAEDYLRITKVKGHQGKRRQPLICGEVTNEGTAKRPRTEPTTKENVSMQDDKIGPSYQYGSDGDEYIDDDCLESFGFLGDDYGQEEEDCLPAIDRSIKADFEKYAESPKHKGRFPSIDEIAIDLLHELRKKSVSLDTYDTMMKWHFASNAKQYGVELVGKKPKYPKKEKVLKKLFRRYNMYEKFNKIQMTTLPSSRAQAKIVTNDAKWCIQSLLTDPQICDKDYLFFNNDPHCPPPAEDPSVIGDINTGKCYIESYRKYIKDPTKQVLLPIIFYIDAAATAQFTDLPITALKFTFGIFNRKARARPHMWRTLGYVPQYSKEASLGRRRYVESGHVESAHVASELGRDEGRYGRSAGNDVEELQDYHHILGIILKEFSEIMETGFEWDLMYNNTLYEGVEFVPYVHFIKCDTQEADKLAGKYGSRNSGVKQLLHI